MPHKILIVDDESDLELLILQKFRSRIKEQELAFEFVENGLHAIDKLQADPDFELVLSDINMHQMDGLTLLDKIKDLQLTPKAVMISAYGDMNNIRMAMNKGAFDFVVKPIDFSDFEITLNKALKESQKQKEANLVKQHLEMERKEKEALIVNQNKMLELKVEERTEQLRAEKQKSDDLLLNILPLEVAEELKEKGRAEAKYFENVTVLFTDFVNFTSISATLTPKELVAEIDRCFKEFDNIIERNGLEKIKTIGDAYMAVGGLPVTSADHAIQVINAAIEIRNFIDEQTLNGGKFGIRIGMHSGPVIAGIVGSKKFSYDIWGDTVNTASRLESNSEKGKINISGVTYELVKDHFECEYRGKIAVKGKGELDMYFVLN